MKRDLVRPFAQRRRLLRGAAAVASMGAAALPVAAEGDAEPRSPFAARSFAEAIGALGGAPTPSPQVAFEVPAVADNGAFVPVTVSSSLPGVREILLLVDVNPQPVAARFTIPAGTEAFVATRIRMAASGTVYAAVRTDDGLFAAARPVSVTVGGCG